MSRRIIIAGGGTGGHIFPAIAIANAIKAKDPTVSFLFIGARGKMEMEKVPQAGYEIEALDIAGFNRSNLFKNITLPYKLVKSFLQVRNIFKKFTPDAVVGVGGYSTFPVLRYAQKKGIPTFIHEANSFAGKSNILLGDRSVKVFTGTEGMEKFFPAEKIMVTGNPVRKNISRINTTRDEALRSFGLSPEKTTLLVMGGSLGARSINDVIAQHVHELGPLNLQLIWQTGKNNAEMYKKRGSAFSHVWVDVFITDMDRAYAAADVVVSRAGAMSVAELCVVKKPVIFVPYPHAAEDHQTVNAMHLVKQDAALLVADKDAITALFPAILNLAMDKAKQMALKTNIAPLGITNADDIIATEILNHISA